MPTRWCRCKTLQDRSVVCPIVSCSRSPPTLSLPALQSAADPRCMRRPGAATLAGARGQGLAGTSASLQGISPEAFASASRLSAITTRGTVAKTVTWWSFHGANDSLVGPRDATSAVIAGLASCPAPGRDPRLQPQSHVAICFPATPDPCDPEHVELSGPLWKT